MVNRINDFGDKLISPAMQGFDHRLLAATVTNRFTHIFHASTECCVSHDFSFPQVFEQFIARDNSLALLDQVKQQIEDEGLHRHGFARITELITFYIERELIKAEDHWNGFPTGYYAASLQIISLLLTIHPL